MSLDAKALLSLVKKKPVLSVCLVVGLGLAITIYARSGLGDEQQAQLDQKRDEGRRYHVNLTSATQLVDDLKTVTEANRMVHERAINPADLARNLQYFYRLEAETGVKFTDLRQMGSGSTAPATAKKQPVSTYVPVNYTISVVGDFPKLINFLRNLEQGAHFYRLNGMTASGTGSTVTLNLNVDLLGQP